MSEPAGIEAPLCTCPPNDPNPFHNGDCPVIVNLLLEAVAARSAYSEGYDIGYANAVADIRTEARRQYAVKDEYMLRHVQWIADAVLPEVLGDD